MGALGKAGGAEGERAGKGCGLNLGQEGVLCYVVLCCAVLCCAVLCCVVPCCAVVAGGGGSSCAVSGPFWPDTHPVQPAGPQRGPCLGLPHRLAELLAGGLPVTPRVTATPKPCPTWAELAGVAREGTRGVVWCGVVWCGVVWCGVVWCAEGAVTKRQRPGCLPTGTGKRAGLCVLCARCV